MSNTRNTWIVTPILATLLAAGCTVEDGRYQGPERPAGLPEAAFWAGGPDGGRVLLTERRQLTARPLRPETVPEGAVWTDGPEDDGVFVFIEKRADDPADIYRAAVYHPDGAPWHTGAFRLSPPGSAALDLTYPFLLVTWTGGSILVSEDRELIAAKD